MMLQLMVSVIDDQAQVERLLVFCYWPDSIVYGSLADGVAWIIQPYITLSNRYRVLFSCYLFAT